MPEFICKDELKRRITTQEPCTYEELEELINDVPVLDVEMLLNDNFERRIVRCKDCKHYVKDFGGGCDLITGGGVNPDGYCNYGEHKEIFTMVKCSECEHAGNCKAKLYNDNISGCNGRLHELPCLPETEGSK